MRFCRPVARVAGGAQPNSRQERVGPDDDFSRLDKVVFCLEWRDSVLASRCGARR
jgi:hypothetical protein